MKRISTLFLLFWAVISFGTVLNNPYTATTASSNTYYGSFAEKPKTLDPARSYSSNESLFTAQIYEPPLQYHYLRRPYSLVPLTAEKMPSIVYLDKNNRPLSNSAPANKIAYSLYTIQIKPGIYYQPHPAFAKDAQGEFLYHHLSEDQIDNTYSLDDFAEKGSRELVAADYVYEIKRLAHPALQSPIFGLMSEYIVGLTDLSHLLQQQSEKETTKTRTKFIDLRDFPLDGVKELDRYSYQIKIKGKYPQFIYWLAMPFFAAIPWEADRFYAQSGLDDHNISMDWSPVGTGAFMLTVNNPNKVMVLQKNPNFHDEKYPSDGLLADESKDLLTNAAKSLPLIDRFVFSLEKEGIPRWTKFLQGYYDASGVSSDSFDQAIHVDENNTPQLTPEMVARQIKLETSVGPSIFYYGFNMLDNVVGGYSKRAMKLRQAISIAFNMEEFISIFLNGRGIPAQGPIAPGIFGYRLGKEGMDSVVYQWEHDHLQRRSLEQAKQLLREAGYPNGRDAITGKPLILNFDVPASSGPDDSARFEWMRKQFAKIGIELQVRATQYNRFQEKMRTGNAQIFSWGWYADYPDPENFLFLLYGPNGKVKFGGENASNYSNPEFDRLFNKMKNLPNNQQRLQIIQQMVSIVQKDSPWIFGFYPQNFLVYHHWFHPGKTSDIVNNTLKYVSLEPDLRLQYQQKWNHPIWWPIVVLAGLVILVLVPIVINYRRKEKVARFK